VVEPHLHLLAGADLEAEQNPVIRQALRPLDQPLAGFQEIVYASKFKE
jgi:hypothetical protein